MRKSLLTLMVPLVLSACGGGYSEDELRELAEVSLAQFEKCDREYETNYKNECEERTGVYYAIVGTHTSSGVRMELMESCSGKGLVKSVDAENLGYEYSKTNKGQCVRILAEIKSENFTTPDIEVLETLWVETNGEKTARLAAEDAAEEARLAAEEARLAALTPTLNVECTNNKGWKAYLQHLDGFATIVRPVDNPAEGYNPIASRITIVTDNNIGFWYDGKEITKQLNVDYIGFRGYSSSKFDKRRNTFSMTVEEYNGFKKKVEGRLAGGIFNCKPTTREAFDRIVASLTK